MHAYEDLGIYIYIYIYIRMGQDLAIFGVNINTRICPSHAPSWPPHGEASARLGSTNMGGISYP